MATPVTSLICTSLDGPPKNKIDVFLDLFQNTPFFDMEFVRYIYIALYVFCFYMSLQNRKK